MTDTELVHQVEQALLGAMITRPRAIAGLGEIPPDLFTDQRHQAIAAALTGTAGQERGALGWLRGFFARFSRRAREAEQYMETLPGLCPDAGHIDRYHQILAEAKALREAVAQATAEQAAARNTQALDGASRNLSVQTGDTPRPAAPGELAPDVARLARTLSTRRPQPAPVPRGGPTPTGTAASQEGPAVQQAPVPAQTAPAPGPPTGSQPGSGDDRPASAVRTARPEDVQDLILASLMRDPDEARNVCAWLPAEVFPEGPRRELFTLITDHVRDRREVDPLIMAWAADLRKSGGPSGDTWARSEGWVSPGFTLGLGRLAPARGTALILGRMLLAEHMITSGKAATGKPVVQATAQAPETAQSKKAQSSEPAPDPGWRRVPVTGQEQRSVRKQQAQSGPQLRPPGLVPGQPGIVPGR